MSPDVLLLVVALATGLMMISTSARARPLGWPARASIVVASLASAVLVSAAWRDTAGTSGQAVPEEKIENRPIAIAKDGYVSSDTCRSCHPHHHESWHASYHRTMTQVPTDDSVIADFDDRVVHYYGHEYRFYRDNGGFFMEMKAPRSEASDGTTESQIFEIVLSTGAHHQQAFWTATDEGRSLGSLPFIWINAEQRWVPYGSIFVAPPAPPGMRPTMQMGLWNRNCIQCHVTRGQPRREEDAVYDSTVAEFGISCGACHGAAEEHAATHRNPLHRYRQHLSSADDTTLVSAPDLSHENSSQVCGQCHSIFDFHDAASEERYNLDGFVYRPGHDLRDSRHVFRFGQDRAHPVVARTLEKSPRFFEQRFWSDGMVRVSGREFNGLLETPCYQRGEMSCLSCHSMHAAADDRRPRKEWADDQLAPGMRGNRACVQCHRGFEREERLVQHTHHAPGSTGSQCYNCHMPHTTLGLMKAMRSHTVDSPDVATTVATGRPNACNLCHLDKTLAWTSEHLEDRYGIAPPTLSDEQSSVAASVLWLLEGDAGQRAIAGWHYGWEPAQEASGTNWMGAFLAELLTDRYDVVRFIGYHSIKELPGFADFDYDFVGSTRSRHLGRLEALNTWHALDDRPAPAEALLVDGEGGLIRERFHEIRRRRLDPPVNLAE